jgi:pimeloyl-ACP methyl ester carboxylesterase
VAVRQEKAVDGFRLAYERAGSGPGSPAVLLLHGWPGDRTDYREVVPLLSGADVVTPDLRGFGESDKHQAEPGRRYTAVAQGRSLIALIGELALNQPVLAGYDIGSRIAVPTTVLWPEYDPLFPREWSDRIGEFFGAARVTWLDGAGHFSPLERPRAFAAAITAAAGLGAG